MKNVEPCRSLDEVREHIDRIDQQLVALIAEREQYVRQAAGLKSRRDDVRAPDRVEQVISRVKSLAKILGANERVVEQTYRSMISGFIRFEQEEYDRHTVQTGGALVRSIPSGEACRETVDTLFRTYIGIDYSGAQASDSPIPGIRVYVADSDTLPEEVLPGTGHRKYWSRKGLAEWLSLQLSKDIPTIVGIDHAFSFPWSYFEVHGIAPDWSVFLNDFSRHWPTDRAGVWVDTVRKGSLGQGALRTGDAHWRRATDRRTRAKSVFHFDVQGSVAKSTHAGLPWIRYLRRTLGDRIHCWPFDGWSVPAGKSVLCEVYPALWSRDFSPDGAHLSSDQRDAYAVAAWMRWADQSQQLSAYFHPCLSEEERRLALVEGWILGVE